MIAELSLQADVVEARMISLALREPPKGGLRGAITEFSRASRRRLVDLMARLSVDSVRIVFMTLTFHGTPSPAEARAALKRFTMRMRRHYPEASALWRKEKQKRGSIHYHLLWFQLPYLPQSELQETWTACTREERSIVDIRLVRSKKAAMAYVSKYIAKLDSPPVPTSLEDAAYQHANQTDPEGRFWGVINREGLPIGELFSVLVEDDAELARFFAYVNDVSKGKGTSGSGSARLYSRHASHVFAYTLGRVREQGESVLERLIELIRWRNRNERDGV